MSLTDINSIYTSSLTDGQVWIGSTGNPPVANTLTAGTGISIDNSSPGNITIANTGPSAFTWNDTGSSTSINLVANNGYLITGGSGGGPTFTTPSGALQGDTYSIMGAGATTGFTVVITGGQTFFYPRSGGYTGTTLTVSGNNAASITLVCLKGTIGVQFFGVLSTNGATFTLA